MNPLHGRRILHYMSPVRFDSNMFAHESDSNYKVMEKTIGWLPECHHYVFVPEKHRIPDNRSNVTLIKYPYPHNAVSNRSQFDATSFLKAIDMRKMDFDFVFTHQPELLYNILVALMDRRYGEILHRFAFFHWVDCSASRGSPAIIPGYMRQLEAINLCSKFFVHSRVAQDYFSANFKKPQATSIFHPYIEGKRVYMPLSSHVSDKKRPFPLPTDRPIVVFNHRWSQSTGMNRFLEFTVSTKDRYLYVITDSTAENVPEGYYVVPKRLDSEEYAWLLSKALATVCFVDGYATWNMAVQDGFATGTPVLVYDHPAMPEILGKDYPLYFKTQDEFNKRLEFIDDDVRDMMSQWTLPNHDATFRQNLLTAMEECVSSKGDVPKDAPAWAWYILNGLHYKNDITNQVQPNLQLNSVWQYIRRWLMQNGITDNPNSPYTSYSIVPGNEEMLKELTKDLVLRIKPKTNKETVINRKNHGFWE
jgi:glycosyltransferase involved in cell wall biosynthesis